MQLRYVCTNPKCKRWTYVKADYSKTPVFPAHVPCKKCLAKGVNVQMIRG